MNLDSILEQKKKWNKQDGWHREENTSFSVSLRFPWSCTRRWYRVPQARTQVLKLHSSPGCSTFLMRINSLYLIRIFYGKWPGLVAYWEFNKWLMVLLIEINTGHVFIRTCFYKQMHFGSPISLSRI